MYKGKENNNEYLKSYAKYFALVFQMIALVVMAGFGGKALDLHFNPESSIFTIILIILAAILALYLLFKTILTK